LKPKVVLAYSGGLDTSVAIHWLSSDRGYDVVALTVDVGNEKDLKVVQERASEIGAVKSVVRDARADFIHYYAYRRQPNRVPTPPMRTSGVGASRLAFWRTPGRSLRRMSTSGRLAQTTDHGSLATSRFPSEKARQWRSMERTSMA
jgi:hypothetical protein